MDDFLECFSEYKKRVILPLCGREYPDNQETRECFEDFYKTVEKDISEMEKYFNVENSGVAG